MHLPQPLVVVLVLAALAAGAILTFYGLFAVRICPYLSECRPDPAWILVLPGVGFVVLSWVICHTTLRSRSGPS